MQRYSFRTFEMFSLISLPVPSQHMMMFFIASPLMMLPERAYSNFGRLLGKTLLGKSRGLFLSVVPAKAGTHTAEFLGEARWLLPSQNASLGLWVPAPVRNCALGRDDCVERLRVNFQ